MGIRQRRPVAGDRRQRVAERRRPGPGDPGRARRRRPGVGGRGPHRASTSRLETWCACSPIGAPPFPDSFSTIPVGSSSQRHLPLSSTRFVSRVERSTLGAYEAAPARPREETTQAAAAHQLNGEDGSPTHVPETQAFKGSEGRKAGRKGRLRDSQKNGSRRPFVFQLLQWQRKRDSNSIRAFESASYRNHVAALPGCRPCRTRIARHCRRHAPRSGRRHSRVLNTRGARFLTER